MPAGNLVVVDGKLSGRARKGDRETARRVDETEDDIGRGLSSERSRVEGLENRVRRGGYAREFEGLSVYQYRDERDFLFRADARDRLDKLVLRA